MSGKFPFMSGSGESETRIQKAQRLADIRASIMRKKNRCCDADLIEVGFTQEQIDDLRPLADGFNAVDTKISESNPSPQDEE